MRIIGDYKIDLKRSAISVEGGPHLFLKTSDGGIDAKRDVTILPQSPDKSFILDSLTDSCQRDGMFLWFCQASHHRFRVSRREGTAIVIQSGGWGSSVIAIARNDTPETLVFYRSGVKETATLVEGVITRTTEALQE
jgi:hypothetical protein